MNLALCFCLLVAQPDVEWQLAPDSTLALATPEEGGNVLVADDDYVTSLSPFDRAVRMQSVEPVTAEQHKAFMAGETLAWDDESRANLQRVLPGVLEKTARSRLSLPERVLLVRTTGDEEGRAAYTRGAAIFLPRHVLEWSEERLEALLLHELFHVQSRHDRRLRDEAYKIVFFERIEGFTFPEEFASRRITNPDAPLIEHAIELELDGKPTRFVPVLLSPVERYDPERGRTLFHYLEFFLMPIEQSGEGWTALCDADGKPRLLAPRELPDFAEKIGRNTNYIIHPEEILADNFEQLLRGRKAPPTPRIQEELAKLLQPSEPSKEE